MKKLLLLLSLAQAIIVGQVKFDKNFESGNLVSVTTTDSINYTAAANGFGNSDTSGVQFYGDDYLEAAAGSGVNSITFQT